jgi:signal transduction histidine kinase
MTERPSTNRKRLPQFITENVKPIVKEWEAFARTLTPSATGMTPLALRDHIHQILEFIVTDIESAQTSSEQTRKSQGRKERSLAQSAAEIHAALRLAGGFDIGQMASEYRALRASVIKLWGKTNLPMDAGDVTDLIRFNESIDQELAESVSHYTYEVARSKDLLLGILGHDLRNPVQSIMFSGEILRRGTLDKFQIKLVDQVVGGADRVNELINSLLDVTRSRFGAGPAITRSPMDLGLVGAQVVDELRVLDPTREILVDVLGNLKGTWDKPRVGQVFSNLIGNALQYGSHDAPVSISIRGDDQAVDIIVHNRGTPIPASALKTIFSPLKRLNSGDHSRDEFANLGLGLFITAEAVEAHGGSIKVTSSDNEGTTFAVRLPRYELSAPGKVG